MVGQWPLTPLMLVRFQSPEPVRSKYTGGSSNGRTADSDSAYLGSNPCPPASILGSSNGRTAASETANTGSNPEPRAINMQLGETVSTLGSYPRDIGFNS